nr:MAG TPA: hypothetical protein [Caudoviricetes sp.]
MNFIILFSICKYTNYSRKKKNFFHYFLRIYLLKIIKQQF